MRGMRADPQPRADTMTRRPVSEPVPTGEQRERVRGWTASPALVSREFGSGGVGHPTTPAWKC